MAKEFSWTFEYIDENKTVAQINRLYELIIEQEKDSLFNLALTIQASAASAFGTAKPEVFKKFLDGLKKIDKKFIDIDAMKLDGLEIEEN